MNQFTLKDIYDKPSDVQRVLLTNDADLLQSHDDYCVNNINQIDEDLAKIKKAEEELTKLRSQFVQERELVSKAMNMEVSRETVLQPVVRINMLEQYEIANRDSKTKGLVVALVEECMIRITYTTTRQAFVRGEVECDNLLKSEYMALDEYEKARELAKEWASEHQCEIRDRLI